MARRNVTWVGILLGMLVVACATAIPRATRATEPSKRARSTESTSPSVPAQFATTTPGTQAGDTGSSGVIRTPQVAWPLTILAIGMAVVLGLIIWLKVHAFLALISAAMIVSLLADGAVGEKMVRVAKAFGESAGNIGIVIALAAVIGRCMLDSGAADRIVRAFLRLCGASLSSVALLSSGFVLAIPVFFDTVFYLLVPLARSLYRQTRVHFLLYILAIGAGGAVTHTLVPPTPGPLVMADQLGIDVGVMILVGLLVAAPAAVVGLLFATLLDRIMPIPMRAAGGEPEAEPLPDDQLPPLVLALAPVLLPVVLISGNTVLKQLTQRGPSPVWLETAYQVSEVLGNANLALLLAAILAIAMLIVQRGLTRAELAQGLESSLMSGGLIILITAGGGAFGAMLKTANVGPAIEHVFSGFGASGLMMLVLGFGLSAVLKIAQGSSTVAMITGSSMLASVAASTSLGFHPVYLATAIGTGSLFGSWMNDSGFWIVAKMSGMTEVEALKSWTTTLIVLALTGLLVTIVLAFAMPYPPFTEVPVTVPR